MIIRELIFTLTERPSIIQYPAGRHCLTKTIGYQIWSGQIQRGARCQVFLVVYSCVHTPHHSPRYHLGIFRQLNSSSLVCVSKLTRATSASTQVAGNVGRPFCQEPGLIRLPEGANSSVLGNAKIHGSSLALAASAVRELAR